MHAELRIGILIIGALFISYIFYQLLKRRINERNALLWFVSCIIIGLLALFPDMLDKMAAVVGIDYPPTLLFLFSTLMILILILQQSMQISILHKQVKELTERLALEHYDLHEKDDPIDDTTCGGEE